jgi:protein-L-isoaspartate(D-aspartate) O-methyltransferase
MRTARAVATAVNPLESLRQAYARRTLALAGVSDAALERAFAVVPRERFVGPLPWRVIGEGDFGPELSADPVALYRDALVTLAIDRGINNGQPSLHAQCLAAVHPRPGERVLHIGAGAGYYSAVLAELVGPRGRVVAYEIEADLAALARQALADHPQVEVRHASAATGAMPVSDVIYVSAGASDLPEAWLDALAPHGRLILPLTADSGVGAMLLVTRRAGATYAARLFDRVSFIGCVGVRDAGLAPALATALARQPLEAVRSLRRHVRPDDSVWLDAGRWWLSRDPP